MAIPVVLWVSILLQIGATYYALRLIKVTKKWMGWVLIALAFSLMAGRRIIVFFHWLYDETPHEALPNTEILALFISFLVFFGLAWIAPLIKSIQDEKEIIEERERTIRQMFDATFEGILVHDKGKILYANRAYANMFGYERDELLGRSIFDLIDDESQNAVETKIRNRDSAPYETVGRRRDGTKVYLENSGTPFLYQGVEARLAAIHDVTYRKEAEKALRESEARLRSIFENAVIGLYQTTPDGRVLLANPALVKMLGFESFRQMATRNLRELGYSAGYPRSEFIRRVERDGQVIGLESKWRLHDGTNLAVRESARVVRDEMGNTLYYEGTIEDITEQKKTEQALENSVEKLRQAFDGILQAIGQILESRDPYTAIHSRNVAKLACAIADKMKLPDETKDALRAAAVVHDLGKIAVPAEILAKPGKLTEIENNMIRHHDQVGHEILRTIDFPWPIADIVRQHHERFDGSGYPDGMAGDEIRIEARILAVADVVEAMCSHRPYRPALGIEKALDEIRQGRGKFFEPDVVDACLDLFEKGEFSFPER